MQDDKNFSSPYSQYFVQNVDYNGESNVLDKVKVAGKIIYSFEAKEIRAAH